ncbi:MAG TPA: hypothetical protein VIV11_00785 [Kofleriaceae bacterium]
MRRLCVAALVVAGCNELTPEQEYEALTDRVAIECGAYEVNYPVDDKRMPPMHLCGDRPNVACMNDAVAGTEIAHLLHSYRGPLPMYLLREAHYFAGDGRLVRLNYYQVGLDDPAWLRWHCESLSTESYDVDGVTCWNFVVGGCGDRF